MERRLSILHVFVLACCALLCAACVGLILSYGGTSRAQDGQLRQEIRLRSFVPGATATLGVFDEVGVTRVHLTATGLPRPQELDQRARKLVVWAVAGGAGGRTVNLGTIEPDARGNGYLEFFSPFHGRYSIIITAEASAQAVSPLGPPVLTTRAGEVHEIERAGSIANRSEPKRDARAEAPRTEPRAETGSEPRTRATTTLPETNGHKGEHGADFYSEVDRALAAKETRTLSLAGGPIAPRARAVARVTMQGGNAFVRARIKGLPAPSAVGAEAYALWARSTDGRTAYLGSLPAQTDDAEVYVRTPLPFTAFDLIVTAEQRRPVIYPSSRNALQPAAEQPRPRKRRRFWRWRRRHRRHRRPAPVS
jgi:hypothetical protein